MRLPNTLDVDMNLLKYKHPFMGIFAPFTVSLGLLIIIELAMAYYANKPLVHLKEVSG
jgi:hypothetical protein